MIVANLYHIKNTNGLFYYGLDYLRENLDLVRLILVRPSMENQVRAALPRSNVIVCSISRYVLEFSRAAWRHDLLYTPTSHPIPGISRQLIVLHDSYPFEVGAISTLKLLLLRWSLSLSRCRVAYINCTDAKPFLVKLGVPNQRMIFAPNKFPPPAVRIPSVDATAGPTTVGLLGTDSKKKNYECLFAAVRLADLSSRLVFRVYGHQSTYFRDLCQQFPDLRIQLAKSDDVSLDQFMNYVDVLASAAEREGFGRPIASALLSGLPVELLDRPVFREFFSGGANFHTTIHMLVGALASHSGKRLQTAYSPPAHVVDAYVTANYEIRQLGSASLN